MDTTDDETKKKKLPPETSEKLLKCRKIAQAALDRAGILDETELRKNMPTDVRWVAYYELDEREIMLRIHSIIQPMQFHHTTPLISITWSVVSELEKLFSDEQARKVFVVEEEEVEETVILEATDLILRFINYLPMVLYHNQHQALKESTIDYIRKFVEPRLKEDWKNQKKSSNFSILNDSGNLKDIIKLFPDTELLLLNTLELTDDEFSTYRKVALSDRKGWLKNPVVRRNLPSEYDLLRQNYSDAKKQHGIEKKAYFELNRGASMDDWDKYWAEFCETEHPGIFFANDVFGETPSRLAYQQLGDSFSYSPEYMQKIVTIERKRLENEKSTDK
jgi:hypothetical protein